MANLALERKRIRQRVANGADQRRSGWRRATLFAGLIAALALMGAATARAATITVGTLTDATATGSCSLRDAITIANGTSVSGSGCTSTTDTSNTIQFSLTGTIFLNNPLPAIGNTSAGSLTITGPTTSPGITIDGGLTHQVMQVAPGATHIANLTIANGSDINSGRAGGIEVNNDGTLTVTNSTFSSNNGANFGGGIYNGGTLTVTNSTFSGNLARNGGGIFNDGTLTVTSSTFSGNRGFGVGGGIFSDGTLTVTNSTFSGNLANFGGGIFSDGELTVSTLTVTNSTFSGNGAAIGGGIGNLGGTATVTLKGTILAASRGGNCDGSINDAGYNISDDGTCSFTKTGAANNGDNVNPDLDPAGLAKNGGPTETIALQSTSPAIGAIPLAFCTDQATPPNPLTTDQRGYVRPSPAHPTTCDIGAFEDNSTPCITLGNALSFALESIGGDVTTGGNASIGKGTTSPGSVVGLDVSLGNSSGVGQNAISSSSALVLGTNTNISGACVTGGSSISFGSAARCGSIDTTGTNPLLTTYSESGIDASAFETAVIDATPTQSIGGFTLAVGGSRTLTDTLSGRLNLVRIDGNVVLNNSSSLRLAGAVGDTVVVDITGNLSLGTNSHIQLSGLAPNQVVIKVRGAISNWGNSSSINGTLLALDSACVAGINDSVNGAVICGDAVTFGSSLRVGFNPATNVCVP